MSQGNAAIYIKLDFKIAMVIEKLPLLGIADFAILHDAAIYEEPPAVEQLDFFGYWFNMADEDEYDEY